MNRRNYVAVMGSVGAAAALCLGTVAQAADKAPTVSACLAKSLKAAQDAKNANNYAVEIQKIQEAQNTAKCTKTPFDEYLMNSWLGIAYVSEKNYEAAAPALQAAAESQYAGAQGRRQMLQAVVALYSQLHQYPKAIAAGQNAIKAGDADSTVYVTVAVDQNDLMQYKQAAETIQQLIDKQPKPEEKYLQFQWDAYIKANDQADANKVIDKLVTYYPKPDYWLNALQPLLKMNINDSHLQLEVYRLMNDVGVLKQPHDVGDMADLTYNAGYPGETVAVLQKAFAANVFTDQRDVMRYQHLLQTSMTKAQTDQASLAAQATKAQSSGSGDQLVALGAAYMSYGQADKAVSLIQAGIAKGGIKNPEEADLLLGMAQLHAHDIAGAHRTFDKVSNSSNAGYAQLGRLWELHSQNHTAA